MKVCKGLGLAVLVLLLSACGQDSDVFSLKVGTCFDDVDELYDEFAEVSTVPIVDCSEPHDNEVYYLFDIPGDEYPGDIEVQQLATDGCYDAFEGYVGRDYMESRFEFAHLSPTRESWNYRNDREIACILYDMEYAKIVGSARNTGE